MLTAAELSAMRSDVADSLPGTAIISRPTTASDGMGGVTATFAAAGTVACRMEPSQTDATESESGGRSVMASPWVLHVPHDTDLNATDRIVYDGGTYEVVELYEPRSWQVHVQAQVVQVR